MERFHQLLVVRKIMVHKMQQEIAAFAVVRRIHGHFSEEILNISIGSCQSTQTIPDIVKRIQTFTWVVTWLVIRLYPASAQFTGNRKVFFYETLCKIEVMACRKVNFTCFIDRIFTENKPVTANDFFIFWRPNNQLFVANFVGIKLIQIQC